MLIPWIEWPDQCQKNLALALKLFLESFYTWLKVRCWLKLYTFQPALRMLIVDHLNIDGPPFPVECVRKFGSALGGEVTYRYVCLSVCLSVFVRPSVKVRVRKWISTYLGDIISWDCVRAGRWTWVRMRLWIVWQYGSNFLLFGGKFPAFVWGLG